MSNANDTFVNAANFPNSNDFIDSLNTLTVDDVVPPHRKKGPRESISVSKIYRIAVVLLCMAVFIYCISELRDIFEDYKKTDDIYGEIQNNFWASINASTGGNMSHMQLYLKETPMVNYSDILAGVSPTYTPQIPGPILTSLRFQKRLSKILIYKDQNPDTYGSMEITGAGVYYPLVQGKDNDHYLTHSYLNTPLRAGAIFIDCRNDRTLENNKNIIIYGHNMANDSMFALIDDYVLDKDFFMNPNNDVVITTFDGLYTFKVFSAYPTVSDDPYFRTHFASDQAFLNFCKEREERSLYHKEGIEFDKDDILITFSTCILGKEDGRYAIHAVLTEIEK